METTTTTLGITLTTSILALGLSIAAIRKVLNKNAPTTPTRETNVVYLHQFPSPKDWPNFSPFCLKLETYLRLSKTAFVDVRALENGPNGKQPWIEWNGERIPDSDTVIRRLEETGNAKSPLNKDPPGAHLAKRAVEEHLYWAMLYSRWVEQVDLTARTFFPDSCLMRLVAKKLIAPSLVKNLHAHGLGRHEKDELYRRATDDLRAVSEVLGARPFLGGDAPCAADASLFGLVANIVWCPFPSPLKDLLVEENAVANLKAHAERVRDLAWGPEWDAKGYRRDAAC